MNEPTSPLLFKRITGNQKEVDSSARAIRLQELQAAYRDDVTANLLITAGYIGGEQLLEAQRVADSLGSDLLDFLAASQWISAAEARRLRAASTLLKEGRSSQWMVMQALKTARQTNLEMEDALRYHGWSG